jgi:hypothetical protein
MGLGRGSSEERIMYDHHTDRHPIRVRHGKTLRAQPRRFLAAPALYSGKWTGADMKAIRHEHGVGRPPKERRK